MRYDPELEEVFFDVLFPILGRLPEGTCRKLALKAHDFYDTEDMGVLKHASKDRD